MRLWTIGPQFLDTKGLVALWREGLLAKAVLEGKTKGYQHHPQLIRFRAHSTPVAAVCNYLHSVLEESRTRGFHFDGTKLPSRVIPVKTIEESKGQLFYEWQHLLKKLLTRAPVHYHRFSSITSPNPHPLFTIVPGEIKSWETVTI